MKFRSHAHFFCRYYSNIKKRKIKKKSFEYMTYLYSIQFSRKKLKKNI